MRLSHRAAVLLLFVLYSFSIVAFPLPNVEEFDSVHQRSLNTWLSKGEICKMEGKSPKPHSCKKSLKIGVFVSKLPSLDRWEGHNLRLLQTTEIFAALDHSLEVTVFHSWNSSATESTSNFFAAVGATLNPLNMPQGKNGHLTKISKRILGDYVSSAKFDFVVLFFSFLDVHNFDFIISNIRRENPAAKVITVLDEPHLSPIEWLPLYYRVTGKSKKPENLSVKEFQQQIFATLDKKYVDQSDMVLLNSIGKHKLLRQVHESLANSSKVQLLRTMWAPLEASVKDISKFVPAPRKDRKNIVFVGTGNLQMNYQALRWFDRNIIRDISAGIPGIICDVYGKNWYRVKHDLENKNMYRFLGVLPTHEIAARLDTYVAFVFPVENTFMGVNPYPLLALERGLPVVMTQLGAQGLCRECSDLAINTPAVFVNDAEVEEKFPFLIASGLNYYNFVEKVKLLHYDDRAWTNYSSKAFAHAKTPWFSRYQAALDMDGYIQALLQ